jgi:hypothetical protein
MLVRKYKRHYKSLFKWPYICIDICIETSIVPCNNSCVEICIAIDTVGNMVINVFKTVKELVEINNMNENKSCRYMKPVTEVTVKNISSFSLMVPVEGLEPPTL